MKVKTGKLIVLEGSCGTGKSTLAHDLKTRFESQGMKAIYGHGALSLTEIGRDFKKATQFYPEFLSTSYYIADLVQLTSRCIKPWLDAGYVVIQDRYSDSIVSYVRAYANLNSVNADLGQIIDLYEELGLLETPDSIVWCYASEEIIFNRLDSRDVAHHKYFSNPELIKSVQNEFAKLYEHRVRNGEVILFETDKERNTESIIEKLL